MKLNNFTAVAALIKERDYVTGLIMRASHDDARVIVGHHTSNDHNVRPDIAAKMLPEIRLILRQEIAIIDQKLAALGVITEQEAA
ncbi:hypothetical protein [Bradyrhizobium sp. SZCCHNR1075]|uniref:hypothetical protein n=1 Tax=Bradyrhizobium sp. SZCCHNR1075 TaxID=3057362 RepID=UPI0028ECE9F3|nr:hypothetical protein [Bradyrhizobium sp. SZCCHNR1075]